MYTKRTIFALAAAAAVSVSGCATMGEGEQQAWGAGIGAAVGCGIGALITHDARGCAVGAAIGGMAGFGVVKLNQYEARQVKSAKAEARMYGLTKPVDSAQVKIRKGSASPKVVKAGSKVKLSTRYSVFLPKTASSVSVSEGWALKKDGKEIMTIPAEPTNRTAGGWEAGGSISMPKDAPPGTYVIEHVVKAGSSYDTDESTFIVKS
jgi:hypothetical protein